MGRPAFTRFLNTARRPRSGDPAGVRWGDEFVAWETLLDRGRHHAPAIRRGHAYVVDPGAGLDALAGLFAVATVPDTTLLWAVPGPLGVAHRQVAPAVSEIAPPVTGGPDRPLWGVCTSGSSGTPKVAIGYADQWESIALHYEQALYGPRYAGDPDTAVATCLPPQFSATFFMTVLPSLFLRRDLVMFAPHDWGAVHTLAARRPTVVLAVPAVAAAACLGTTVSADMSRATLFLGGGHVSGERVRLIRQRYTGVELVNLYGTAETGAVSTDHDPGHNEHVGRPVDGKAVWLRDVGENGIGTLAAAGPDCAAYLWRPGETPVANDGYVTGTDYARFDDHGRLCLEGRVDGGEKFNGMLVYPRAVERHLLALDGVVDARVLVRRTATGLEQLVARVVGRTDEGAVREHCAVLAPADQPTVVECVSERDAAPAYSSHGKL
ncbi:AMP-binding protein [Actinoplanes xinjiangensis]|uniref:AMP-binding protein n=1 Tax=Actinoplanes xinjiangensis TaxID=512350 RepID=UPI003429478A